MFFVTPQKTGPYIFCPSSCSEF